MSDTSDRRLEFIWEEAAEGVNQQAAQLNELRTRAASLFSGASIAAGFLGVTAFTAHPSRWAWVGAAMFCCVGIVCGLILMPWGGRKNAQPPKWQGWRFNRSPAGLKAFLDYDRDEMLDRLAQALEEDFDNNARGLKWLTRATALSCGLLIFEILTFMIAVTRRG